MTERESWGDVDLTWEAPKQTKLEVSESTLRQKEKLKNPVVQIILRAMLTSAVLAGAGATAAIGYETVTEGLEQAEQKIENNNQDKLKSDLTARLADEGVTEADISSVLSDPELMQLYEELRSEPQSFDEVLKEHGIEIGEN